MIRVVRNASSPWLPALVAGAALGALGWLLVRRLGEGRASNPPMDLPGLRARMSASGAVDVDVRSLGPGIVELVGTVRAPERAARLVETASRTPGVDVVVNRLWSEGAEAISRPGAKPKAGAGPN